MLPTDAQPPMCPCSERSGLLSRQRRAVHATGEQHVAVRQQRRGVLMARGRESLRARPGSERDIVEARGAEARRTADPPGHPHLVARLVRARTEQNGRMETPPGRHVARLAPGRVAELKIRQWRFRSSCRRVPRRPRRCRSQAASPCARDEPPSWRSSSRSSWDRGRQDRRRRDLPAHVKHTRFGAGSHDRSAPRRCWARVEGTPLD